MSGSMGALDGLLVVALEQAVAAPLCTAKLADAGARVIKIERAEGDFARGYDAAVKGQASYFVWLNRGKESLTLDIKNPDDKALLEAGGYVRLRRFLGGWTAPKFPLAGADLIAIGVPAGPKMGNLLRDLEEAWIDAGFAPDRAGLLEKAESLKSQYL